MHTNITKLQDDNILYKDITQYLQKTKNHNTNVYCNYLKCHIYCLFLDVICFVFMNACLQGRFFTYVFRAFPYHKDVDDFSDEMSQAFPPFASCLINEKFVFNGREELLRCHLTLMELYEKVFVFIWIWMVFLFSITCIFSLRIILLSIKYVKHIFIRNMLDSNQTGMLSIIEKINVGDVYLLYKIKGVTHSVLYKRVLKHFVTEEEEEKNDKQSV